LSWRPALPSCVRIVMQVPEDARRNGSRKRHHERRRSRHAVMLGALGIGLTLSMAVGASGAAAQTSQVEGAPGSGKSLIERLAEWLHETNRAHQELLTRLSRPVEDAPVDPQVAAPAPMPAVPVPTPSEGTSKKIAEPEKPA